MALLPVNVVTLFLNEMLGVCDWSDSVLFHSCLSGIVHYRMQ